MHARTHASSEPERNREVTLHFAIPVSRRLVWSQKSRRIERLRVVKQIWIFN